MSRTPGPWKCYTRALGGGPLGGADAPFAVVCRAFPGDVIPAGAEIGMCVAEGVTPENGRLIAAAPDLLRAAQVAHSTMKRQLGADGMGPDWWGDDEHEAFTVLKEAIAKASTEY